MKVFIFSELQNHDFEKQNMVTIKRGKKMYDLHKCKNCGIEGKRTNFLHIEFKESVNNDLIKYCKKTVKKQTENNLLGKKIKITHCAAFGKTFENLTRNSEHEIVEPPENQKEKYPNHKGSVWVMGIGEPVRLLSDEFIFID